MKTFKRMLVGMLILSSACSSVMIATGPVETRGFAGADLPADVPVDPSSDGNNNTANAGVPSDTEDNKRSSVPVPPIPSSSMPDKTGEKKEEEFTMPFLAPNSTIAKPGYDFFNKLQKEHPKSFLIPAFVTLVIASTYCLGKGMDYTSALIKKLAKKPKHKETERLYNDFGTKLGAVVAGHGVAEVIRYVFNGFTKAS